MAPSPSRLAIAAALGAVYLIWGSTYLAIRFAVVEMPPFLMAGARWIAAGVALYAWRRAAGDARPALEHWRAATIIGALLIVGGNGTVSWAEQHVESGLTALLIAIVPVWIALLAWGQTGERPTLRVGLGVVLGVGGVALLFAPALASAQTAAIWGIGAILLATVLWAAGSMYSRRAPLPKSALLGAAMEMIAGGVLLTLLGLATGEPARVDLTAVSWKGWASLAFLAVFGSIVAYSAYVWLLQVTRAELVATYAFVNPVVAVVLGVVLAGESLAASTLAASFLIVVAVAIVVTAPRPRPPSPPPAQATDGGDHPSG